MISEITGIEGTEIGNEDSFAGDLGLDSLTLLEIGVHVDQAFGLQISEDDMQEFTSISASANLVQRYLLQRAVG